MKNLSTKFFLLLMSLNVFSLSATAADECRLLVQSLEKITSSDVEELGKKFDAIISTQLGEAVSEKIRSYNERRINGVPFSEDEIRLNDLSAQIEATYKANPIPGISVLAYVSDNADLDAIKIRLKSRFLTKSQDEEITEILSDRSIILYYNGEKTYSLHIGQDDAGSDVLDDFLKYRKDDCESALPKIEPEPVLGVEIVDQKRETSPKPMEESESSAPSSSSNAAK